MVCDWSAAAAICDSEGDHERRSEEIEREVDSDTVLSVLTSLM